MHNIIRMTDKMNFEHKFTEFKLEADMKQKEIVELDKIERKKEYDDAERKRK